LACLFIDFIVFFLLPSQNRHISSTNLQQTELNVTSVTLIFFFFLILIYAANMINFY